MYGFQCASWMFDLLWRQVLSNSLWSWFWLRNLSMHLLSSMHTTTKTTEMRKCGHSRGSNVHGTERCGLALTSAVSILWLRCFTLSSIYLPTLAVYVGTQNFPAFLQHIQWQRVRQHCYLSCVQTFPSMLCPCCISTSTWAFLSPYYGQTGIN